MKQSSGSSSSALLRALLLIFLLSSCSILLVPKPGEGLVEIEQENSLESMGMEKCGVKDEECLKRRMMGEAHLDYIYTDNLNKP
ncbi:hypothetical protein Syun_000559 [Stephania yunnanensis]|uniref:Phytosulfokine n=1 Tax=Stephania yunnanensis TaxID=152371 RepID=A0AAP0LG78_9MAGN